MLSFHAIAILKRTGLPVQHNWISFNRQIGKCWYQISDGVWDSQMDNLGLFPRLSLGKFTALSNAICCWRTRHYDYPQISPQIMGWCRGLMMIYWLQALAGPGLPDHLHHWPSRHAEAKGCVLAVSTQLPPGNDLLFRGVGARPTSPENHLPQEPGPRGKSVCYRVHTYIGHSYSAVLFWTIYEYCCIVV